MKPRALLIPENHSHTSNSAAITRRHVICYINALEEEGILEMNTVPASIKLKLILKSEFMPKITNTVQFHLICNFNDECKRLAHGDAMLAPSRTKTNSAVYTGFKCDNCLVFYLFNRPHIFFTRTVPSFTK
jgi:hypothetical protein